MSIVCILILAIGGFADRILLNASTQPMDAGNVTRREIQCDAARIDVLTAGSPGVRAGAEPQAFVLEFCGSGTRAEEITRYVADRWGSRPVEVWVMNYPGYGRSTGPVKLHAIPPAALATFDAMAAVAGSRPVCVAGSSLGSTVALHVAANRNVSGVIIQSPPPLQRMILGRHGLWNGWLIAVPIAMAVPTALNSLDNAPKVKAPTLILLTGRDSVVPLSYQLMVESRIAQPKRRLLWVRLEHNDPIAGSDARELHDRLDWFWSEVVKRPRKP